VTHFSVFLQNICRLSASIFIDPQYWGCCYSKNCN